MAKRRMSAEQIVALAKREFTSLRQKKAELEAELAEIDGQLEALSSIGATVEGPSAGPSKARRPATAAAPAAKPAGKKRGRKKMTMYEHVGSILKAARASMGPKDIAHALRQKNVSASKSLSTQVSQILKSGKVAAKKLGRGQYEWAGDR